MIKISSGIADALPEGLIRDLKPMAAQIRATLPALAKRGIVSKSEAKRATRALKAALRSQWSDARIRQHMAQRGGQVLRAADRDWAPLTRKLDSRRIDMSPKIPNGIAMLQGWISDSVPLITGIRDEAAGGLERDLLHAIANDWTPEQLAEAWRNKPGISLLWGTLEGRTKVIAHTELRKLRTNIQQQRSQAIGVKQFEWESRGDSWVRPRHRELDGTVWDWDDPPNEGLPGHPVNCRCIAVSVVTESLMQELGITGVAGAIEGRRAA